MSPSAILTLLVVCSILYLCFGYFGVPYVLKTVVSQQLARQLDRPVTIGHVTFNPILLRLTLDNGIIGPRLTDPNDKVDPILSVSSLIIDLDGISLVKRGFICSELTITQPFIHLVHEGENQFNLGSLISRITASRGQPHGLLAQLVASRYSINNILIQSGEVIYDDLPTDKVHRMQELNVSIPAIANISYQRGELNPSFSARINGTHVEMGGRAQMVEGGTMTARLNMKMTDLSLEAYKDYIPSIFGIKAISGKADIDMDLLYDAAQSEKLKLEGSLSLRAAQVEGAYGRFSMESGLFKGWLAPFGNRYHAEEITLTHPVWQRPAGPSTSWSGLAVNLISGEGDSKRGATINHLQITSGEILDAETLPSSKRTDWMSIDTTINTTPRTPSDPKGAQQAFYSLSARMTDGASVSLQGSAQLAPFSAKGVLGVSKIGVATLLELGQGLGFSLPPSHGVIEQLQTNYELTVSTGEKFLFSLDPLSIQAKDLKIDYNGQWLEIPVWQSERGSVKTNDPVLHLGTVRLQQAKFACRRQSADGSWYTTLTKAEGQASTQPMIDFEGLDISNSSLVVENQGPPDFALHLERFDLQVDQISSSKDNNVHIGAMVEDKYPIQATGNFTLNPFSASLAMVANDLPLTLFEPLLAQHFANPIAGNLSLNGTLTLPTLDYKGQWGINAFSEPPVSCRRMSGEETLFTLRPTSLLINALDIEGGSMPITIGENGIPRLPTILKSGLHPAQTSAEAMLTIKEIAVRDFTVTSELPGGVTVSSQKINGSVSDFIVAKEQSILFDFGGEVERKASFSLKGKIKPFDEPIAIGLACQIDHFPLTVLAPLLEPYWGYTIKAGSLDLESAFGYENTLIHDSARVTIHDLLLGQPTDAAVIKAIGNTWQSLPLVQAMLQDATGRIKLTVPIDGRTDAGFTYMQGMKSFFSQLLLKTSVSPMNLVADQRMALADTVVFDAGSDRLPVSAEEELRELAGLLRDRSLLMAKVSGLADNHSDSKIILRGKKTELLQTRSSEAILLALAARRARVVHDYLVGRGVAPRQIRIASPEVVAASQDGRTGHRVMISLSAVE